MNTLKAHYFNLENDKGFSGLEELSKTLLKKRLKNRREKTRQWLLKQPSFALHFPIKKKVYPRQEIPFEGIHVLWEVDLFFISKNIPILAVIDSFSKRGDVRVLKNKRSEEVAAAFEDIILNSRYLSRKTMSVIRHPARLRSDFGLEFRGSHFKNMMKKYDIHQFYAMNPDVKACIVERWIRTLQTRLHKYMTHKNISNFSWKDKRFLIEVLSKLVASYNKRRHSTIGMAPESVNLLTQAKIFKLMEKKREKMRGKKKIAKYKIGDKVRISSYKNVFAKGFKTNFSRNPFEIIRKSIKTPWLYTLTDCKSGDVIEGRFYEQELIPYNAAN